MHESLTLRTQAENRYGIAPYLRAAEHEREPNKLPVVVEPFGDVARAAVWIDPERLEVPRGEWSYAEPDL